MNEYIQKQLMNRLAGGGRVQGAGNGISDSIPLPLKDKQGKMAPAALSDGEYVIKADIVSKIGGGSTNPGFDFFDEFVNIVAKLDRELAADFAEAVLVLAEVYLEEQPQIDEDKPV